jgi:chromosome segregation ATPase
MSELDAQLVSSNAIIAEQKLQLEALRIQVSELQLANLGLTAKLAAKDNTIAEQKKELKELNIQASKDKDRVPRASTPMLNRPEASTYESITRI